MATLVIPPRALLLFGTLALLSVASPATAAPVVPSLGGTTGLVNVPTAEVAESGRFYLGYNVFNRKWSYEGRGTLENRIYYFTLGFLPNLEVSVRATRLPGESLLENVKADAVDRMGSFRYRLVRQGHWPALAVGMDDVKGTRRLHSFYLVGTKDLRLNSAPVGAGLTAGYGFRTFKAARHLLDGGFGGFEIYLGKWASGAVEYDSEKWNTGLRLVLFSEITAHLAFLNLDTPSGGAAWTHRF